MTGVQLHCFGKVVVCFLHLVKDAPEAVDCSCMVVCVHTHIVCVRLSVCVCLYAWVILCRGTLCLKHSALHSILYI